MMKKKLFASLVFGLSLNTYAVSDLVVVNQTDLDSTARINGGLCSSVLSGGITSAHSTNTIPANVVGMACFLTPHNCAAEVYMSDDCSGVAIGMVIFDKNNGVQSISNTAANYAISKAAAFNIVISSK